MTDILSVVQPMNTVVTLNSRHIRLIRNICQSIKDGGLKHQDFGVKDANDIMMALGCTFRSGSFDIGKQ